MVQEEYQYIGRNLSIYISLIVFACTYLHVCVQKNAQQPDKDVCCIEHVAPSMVGG